MKPLSGGCQCGAIRYRITGHMGDASICHCRMCQKAFGSWGAALVTVDLREFIWTRGEPAKFKSSPLVERRFCSSCGTPLAMFEEGDSFIDMAIGTLDTPNAVPHFTAQIGMESKVNWFDGMKDLQPLATVQTRKPEDLAQLKTLQHPDHDTEKWP